VNDEVTRRLRDFLSRPPGSIPWTPVALLAISAVSFGVFRTHAWPGGPVAFGALALATAWLRWKAPS